MILRMLAKDYDCLNLLGTLPAQDQDDVAGDDFSGFTGLIGVYALTESAGQRAKQVLHKLLPKATVEISDDHAATDRLRHLAASADIFVFARRSRKHQAYYCVKEPVEFPLTLSVESSRRRMSRCYRGRSRLSGASRSPESEPRSESEHGVMSPPTPGLLIRKI